MGRRRPPAAAAGRRRVGSCVARGGRDGRRSERESADGSRTAFRRRRERRGRYRRRARRRGRGRAVLAAPRSGAASPAGRPRPGTPRRGARGVPRPPPREDVPDERSRTFRARTRTIQRRRTTKGTGTIRTTETETRKTRRARLAAAGFAAEPRLCARAAREHGLEEDDAIRRAHATESRAAWKTTTTTSRGCHAPRLPRRRRRGVVASRICSADAGDWSPLRAVSSPGNANGRPHGGHVPPDPGRSRLFSVVRRHRAAGSGGAERVDERARLGGCGGHDLPR